MAQEILVKDALSREMIEAGRDLIEQLDRTGFGVTMALWLYTAQFNQWRLWIVSPKVGTLGPQKAYGEVRVALSQLSKHSDTLSVHDVTVDEPSDSFISQLRVGLKPPAPGTPGYRLSQTVNGYFVDDSWIYRVN